MKTNAFRVISSVLGLLLLLGLCACKKEPLPPQGSEVSQKALAPAGSFEAVTRQLDPGGDLYAYLGTEQCLSGLSQKMAGWGELLDGLNEVKTADRENLMKLLGVLTNLVASSGVEEMRGFGISSVPRDGGMHRTKAVLYHPKGGGAGFFWNLFGREPHALHGLDLLPASTAMASFSDLDAALLWSVIKKQASQAGGPQAEEMLNKLPEAFQKATGLEWDKVLGSLGGEFGFAITLDEEKTVSVPLPGDQRLEFPEPALMLVAKVKDETIFNRVDEALKKAGQQVFSTDKPNLRMRTVGVPVPLPLQLGPTIAIGEGYLFIASTDSVIQQALAVKAGQKAGLKTTEEFKRLAKDLPQQGNHFTYVSQRFSQTVNRVQRQALRAAPGVEAKQAQWLQSMLMGAEPPFYYTVAGHTAEGWLWAANGNQAPSKFLLASAVVPAGIVAAVAAPNFIKARQNAQRNACLNNLGKIDSAKRQWAETPRDTKTPSEADLLPFLGGKQFPKCPAGGAYTIGEGTEPAQCSIPGHQR